MQANIIDLSVSISEDNWEPEPVKRLYLNHKDGADKLGESYAYFKSNSLFKKWYLKLFKPKKYVIDHKDFPDEQGLSLMTYSLTTHTGTHIDAPFHYGHREDQAPQRTVTDIPLSWCYGPGVLLDFSADGAAINAENIQKKLTHINYELQVGDIVLINTGAGENIGKKNYFTHYRAIEPSALAWLCDHGVNVIGTDAFSFDPPFCDMIDRYKETGDKSVLWPAHFFGRDREYIQIERLGNLADLPTATGFKVCCFPIKLDGADAAWSRVVAIYEH